MQSLNIEQIPLLGHNLIEASAGTGKTYTIAGLYLRSILNQFGHTGFNEQIINSDNIVVLTFTNAATEELRQRIRDILLKAKANLVHSTGDDTLVQAIIDAADDKHFALAAINYALAHIDLAKIFTIHGFCQFLLKEYALDAKRQLQESFLLDESELDKLAFLDFWRAVFSQLPEPILQTLLASSRYANYDACLKTLTPLMKDNLCILPRVHLDTFLEQQEPALEKIAKAKQLWLESNMAEQMAAQCKKNRTQGKVIWLDAMNDFCRSDGLIPVIGSKKTGWSTFCTSQVEKAGGARLLTHPVFPLIDALMEWEAHFFPELESFVIQTAQAFCLAWKREKKQQMGVVSADDLLNNLYTALHQDASGQMAKKIRQQFPVAFIDEYQDTDRIQYGIFRQIYATPSQCAVFYIGDPKQAIYSFRGADIHTYLATARDTTASARFTLNTNWRSSSAMIHACNRLFSYNPHFFGRANTVLYNTVAASGRADGQAVTVDSMPLVPISLIYDPDADTISNRTSFLEHAARVSARQVAQLLATAHIGQRPVQSQDVTILVRDKVEANTIKAALKSHHINSVFLSKDSVFQSRAASDFRLIINALTEPENWQKLRSALASDFFLFDDTALSHQTESQTLLMHQTCFSACHNIWQNKGILSAILSLVHQYRLPSIWLQHDDGERYLTDIRHLTELLQEQTESSTHIHKQYHWFCTQLEAASQSNEKQRLRLETDASLVKIETIHASKGLEYDIVFLPFACWSRQNKQPLFYDQEQERFCFDSYYKPDSIVRSDQYAKDEEARLLYVALTRAKYMNQITIVDNKHIANSAIGKLLNFTKEDTTASALERFLNQETKSGFQLTLVTDTNPLPASKTPQHNRHDRHDSDSSTVTELKACTVSRSLANDWRVHSFTSISNQLHRSHGESTIVDESPPPSPPPSLEPEAEQQQSVMTLTSYNFPKGAHTGNLLHKILERIDFDADSTGIAQTVNEQLQVWSDKILLTHSMDDISHFVTQWVQQIVRTHNQAGQCLADIASRDRLIEMEFYVPASHVSIGQINPLLVKHDYPPLPGKPHIRISGLIKGYIDLCFRHDGKYYIADYKTNALGPSPSDYDRQSLRQAMTSHLYHLQYLIYTTAFYRHCLHRNPDFDYNQAFGGVYYYFLRGMHPDHTNHAGIYHDKPSFELIHSLNELLYE